MGGAYGADVERRAGVPGLCQFDKRTRSTNTICGSVRAASVTKSNLSMRSSVDDGGKKYQPSTLKPITASSGKSATSTICLGATPAYCHVLKICRALCIAQK